MALDESTLGFDTLAVHAGQVPFHGHPYFGEQRKMRVPSSQHGVWREQVYEALW